MITDPDWCYDVDNWEKTYNWRDREDLTDNLSPGDIMEVGCLAILPEQWAVCMTAKNGVYVIEWFASKAEAEAAAAAWRATENTDA